MKLGTGDVTVVTAPVSVIVEDVTEVSAAAVEVTKSISKTELVAGRVTVMLRVVVETMVEI